MELRQTLRIVSGTSSPATWNSRALVFWVTHWPTGARCLGVTSANLMENLANPDLHIRRLLGVEPGSRRNLGRHCIIGMDRGLNDQWTRGGMIFGFPTR